MRGETCAESVEHFSRRTDRGPRAIFRTIETLILDLRSAPWKFIEGVSR